MATFIFEGSVIDGRQNLYDLKLMGFKVGERSPILYSRWKAVSFEREIYKHLRSISYFQDTAELKDDPPVSHQVSR